MNQPLRVDSLRVNRARGIGPDDAFAVTELRAGVNLLYGPNGAGKTTTARALQELLWPRSGDLDRPWIAGKFQLNGDQWEAEVEGERLRWWHNGAEVREGPPVGSVARCRCYYISLAQLLQAEERASDIAEQVSVAMRGGLDLEAARKRLGVGESPAGRYSLQKELKQLQRKVDRARQVQREVRDLDRDRSRLRRRIEAAEAAAWEVEQLQVAVVHREHQDRCEKLRAELSAMPSSLGSLRGDELERAQSLQEQRDQLQQGRRRQSQREADAQRALDECDLPEDGPDGGRIIDLRNRCQRLAKLDQQAATERRRLAEMTAKAEHAKVALGEHVTEQQLWDLGKVEVHDVGALARETEQVCAKRRTLEAQEAWLGEERSDEAPDAEAVSSGMRLLTEWLGASPADEPAARTYWPGLIAIGALAVLGVVLAVAVHPGWSALLFAAAGLGGWQWRLGSSAAADHRPAHVQAYRRSGLADPEAWTAERVLKRLQELAGELATVRLEERRRARSERLEEEQRELADRERQLERRRQALQDQLGLRLETDRDAWLVTLAGRLAHWQQASADADAAAKALEVADGERGTLSDDERAAAVIDAVVEIAREGRQVFYMTAQHDEVGKWLHRLRDDGLSYTTIDLARLRGMRETEPLPIVPVEPPTVPSPEGMSHEEYGRALNVPPIDPWSDSSGTIHLWYLIDDDRRLHGLLRHGIHTWGQFRSLVQSGGHELVEDGDRLYRCAEAAVRVIETLCRLWRAGRGRPVDRAVLQAAECVGERFLDQIAAVADECEADAERILERVDEIHGWGRKSTQKLREYLEASGCLDSRDVVPSSEARAQALAACAQEMRETLLDSGWLDRMLGMIFR